jgi:hypothetical protein
MPKPKPRARHPHKVLHLSTYQRLEEYRSSTLRGMLDQKDTLLRPHMEQRTFEGTWEEIAHRGPELAGRKVRLTVLDELSSDVSLDRALAPLIANAERLVSSLPPVAPCSPAQGWSEGVIEKYRRQGFKL